MLFAWPLMCEAKLPPRPCWATLASMPMKSFLIGFAVLSMSVAKPTMVATALSMLLTRVRIEPPLERMLFERWC